MGSTEGDAGHLREGGGEGVFVVIGCYAGAGRVDGEADGACISEAVPDSRLGRVLLGPHWLNTAQTRVAAINKPLNIEF